MPTEAQHSETMSGEPSSSARTVSPPACADVSADTAVILAALGRLDAAVRGERDTLERLREQLGEMAQAIARAKAVADSETSAAMLDEFEHRVDAMIEIAGGRPAATMTPPEAESDEVPTVSSVVHRLSPQDTVPGAEAAPPADSADDSTPSHASVAMLTAMVEALSASIQAPPQEPEQHEPEAQQLQAPEPEAQTIQAPEPAEIEPAEPAAIEPAPAIEAAAEPAPLPSDNVLHETALLASLEQMESRPIPPPDEGTAVIFTPKPEPSAEPEASMPPEPGAEPAPEFATLPPAPAEAAVTPEPELLAAPQPVPPAEAVPATVQPPEADFDPTDFLFGPEPEPDPAAFLLDPAPPRPARAVALPQPEFVADPPPAEPPPVQPAKQETQPIEELPATEPDVSPSAEAVQPAEPAPHDPLHALKALSENEKIAIFS